MYGFYSYFIYILPALLISLYAQAKVHSTFSKYQKVSCSKGYSGEQIARIILNAHGLSNVQIERVPGKLSDHFDPTSNVVRLSDSTFDRYSVSAIGVAAHEVGHAIQYAQGYTPMKIRGAIVGATKISSSLSIVLFFVGFLFANSLLMTLGIIFFSIITLFQLVTLPVEYNASHRALAILSSQDYLTSEELQGVRKVLSAAALTYVAALLMSLAQLIRLIALSSSRRD